MNYQSVTDAITTDHRELETYYNNIMNAADHDTATRWQNQFVWELARHSIAEVRVTEVQKDQSIDVQD